jgi:hypothetical protein
MGRYNCRSAMKRNLIYLDVDPLEDIFELVSANKSTLLVTENGHIGVLDTENLWSFF